MANVNRRPVRHADKDVLSIYDHFTWLVTAHEWTTLVADAGSSVAVGDAAGGVVVVTSGGTDNNEAMIRSTNELFLPVAGKPLDCESWVQYAEAATNAANIFVGFASAAGANLLVDDGGGPRTSGSIIGIYKKDGETEWRLYTRNGSTYNDTLSSRTAGGSAYQKIEIFIEEYSLTECIVTCKIDGNYLKYPASAGVAAGLPIEHRVAYSGLTEMNFVPLYVKAGTGASQVASCDLACGTQQI